MTEFKFRLDRARTLTGKLGLAWLSKKSPNRPFCGNVTMQRGQYRQFGSFACRARIERDAGEIEFWISVSRRPLAGHIAARPAVTLVRFDHRAAIVGRTAGCVYENQAAGISQTRDHRSDNSAG